MRMRARNCSVFVSGKICTALLLGLLLIMIMPVGYVTIARHVAAGAPQAPLFTAIDLHPSGFLESHGIGISGAEQVGYGAGPATVGHTHALLWRGGAMKMVDLHPSESDFG